MRSLVLVNGPVASGKSTLSDPLARRLGLPLLAKDAVKEALFDALGSADLAWSKRLSGAAYAVLFAVASSSDAAVFDGNFQPEHARTLGGLCSRPVEVFCTCPPEECLRRFQARERHPGHHDEAMSEAVEAQIRRAAPLALGGPVLEVDTSQQVDVDGVVTWVRDQLHDAGRSGRPPVG